MNSKREEYYVSSPSLCFFIYTAHFDTKLKNAIEKHSYKIEIGYKQILSFHRKIIF